MPYDKEIMQGKKTRPKGCWDEETFSDMFKPAEPKFKFGLGINSVIVGTMIKGKNLKITNYKSKD